MRQTPSSLWVCLPRSHVRGSYEIISNDKDLLSDFFFFYLSTESLRKGCWAV